MKQLYNEAVRNSRTISKLNTAQCLINLCFTSKCLTLPVLASMCTLPLRVHDQRTLHTDRGTSNTLRVLCCWTSLFSSRAAGPSPSSLHLTYNCPAIDLINIMRNSVSALRTHFCYCSSHVRSTEQSVSSRYLLPTFSYLSARFHCPSNFQKPSQSHFFNLSSPSTSAPHSHAWSWLLSLFSQRRLPCASL